MPHAFRHALGAAALACTLGLSTAAQATDIIDFESASLSGLILPGEVFTSGPATLTTLLDFGLVDTAGALGALAPSGNATTFYFASNDGQLRLQRTDGTAFNLDAFSAAFVSLDPPSTQTTAMVAVGVRADSSTAQLAWNWVSDQGGSPVFSTFATGGQLSNLVYVDFRACAFNGVADCAAPTLNNGQFAIDDIQISPVPEPGSALLLALGLAAFGLRQRLQAR